MELYNQFICAFLSNSVAKIIKTTLYLVQVVTVAILLNIVEGKYSYYKYLIDPIDGSKKIYNSLLSSTGC